MSLKTVFTCIKFSGQAAVPECLIKPLNNKIALTT